jgi:hypothetical protein
VVHYGLAAGIREQRAAVLAAAYAAHPERFIRAMPQPPKLPTAVWINPPTQEATTDARCLTGLDRLRQEFPAISCTPLVQLSPRSVLGGASESERTGEMGKVIVMNGVTLDGVIQGPGRPDEDTRDGFAHGGLVAAFQLVVGGLVQRHAQRRCHDRPPCDQEA